MQTISQKNNNTILIIGILIAFLYYPFLGHLVFLGQGINLQTLALSRLFIWSEVLLLFIYARKIENNSLLLWKDERYPFSFYVLSVFLLYIIAIACGLVATIPKILGYHDYMDRFMLMEKLLNKSLPLLVFTCITAGFTEELIFRGYLLPRLEILFKNKWLPVIASALMFAGLHYSYFNVKELIYSFLIGVVFALHYQKYRNIKVLIAFHALLDLIAVLLYRVYLLKPH